MFVLIPTSRAGGKRPFGSLPPRLSKMTVTPKIISEVLARDNSRCVICRAFAGVENFPMPKSAQGKALESIPHHGLFRSEYFKQDRDKAWNLFTICVTHHRIIHGGYRTHLKYTKIARDYCRNLSLSRQPLGIRPLKTKKKLSHEKKMKAKYPYQKL